MRSTLLLAIVLFLTTNSPAGQPGNPVFVSTHWLAEHLADPNLVVLHVGFNRGEYRLEHIPGARFLWYEWLTVSTPDASTEMANTNQADSVLRMLGLSRNSRIVLCWTGSSLTTTTRTFLALSYFGFADRTSILDGGLEQWKREERPLSTDAPHVTPSNLNPTPCPQYLVDALWVKGHLDDPAIRIVDSRDKRYFDGNGGGARRQGHIRGAVSIPFSMLVDSTNCIKQTAALEKIFDEAGIRRGMKIVTYCHVGQQATLTYAVLRQLGFEAVVYDGSFQDWNVRGDGFPVEKPDS